MDEGADKRFSEDVTRTTTTARAEPVKRVAVGLLVGARGFSLCAAERSERGVRAARVASPPPDAHPQRSQPRRRSRGAAHRV